MAHVIPVPEQGMDATKRCDRCGAQAYVEVALATGTLLFCAHHFGQSEEAIMKIDKAMIADHRAFLKGEEARKEATPTR